MAKVQHLTAVDTISLEIAVSQQNLLKVAGNWSAGSAGVSAPYYIGAALSGNKQGQEYHDGLYLYRFIRDDYPIRILCS